MSEADIRAERLKKLEKLQAAGIEAYPVSVERDYSISEVLERFETLETDAASFSIVGRIMALRSQGGIMFVDLYDGSASLTTGGTERMQAVVQKEETKEFDLFAETVDTGDFIQVTGTPFVTKRGERSIKVTSWKMVAKALLPIPD
ncbi:MAG TPA: OB-fold nucleic acid binding domain-containing protein, partial [Candidatus Paceibacterota bacterium]|nr:OB-fold nucleic acid binding domain-containing protein [Candidatus Paceibacterota bacterium]